VPRTSSTKAPPVYLLFATARFAPAGWYSNYLSFLIRFLTRSDLSHCSIAFCSPENQWFVMDPSLNGYKWRPAATFIATFPTLAWMVEVPVKYYADPRELMKYEDPIPALPTVLSWLSFGLKRTHDCVWACKDLLATTGIDVPRHITSPRTLLRWAFRNGNTSIYIGKDRTTAGQWWTYRTA